MFIIIKYLKIIFRKIKYLLILKIESSWFIKYDYEVNTQGLGAGRDVYDKKIGERWVELFAKKGRLNNILYFRNIDKLIVLAPCMGQRIYQG